MPFILPEEQAIYEKEIVFSKHAFACWAKHYLEFGWQVLYPEVTFLIPLPRTEHHCYWMHNLLHPDEPVYRQEYPVTGYSCSDRRCYMPHYLKGKCDGIIQRQGKIWLLETKTTGADTQPYRDSFQLAIQPTAYIYGASRALGIRINGFVLNIIRKPRSNFMGSIEEHFAKDPFGQEAFLRSDEDLDRFEYEAKIMWDERERAHREGIIYMNTKSCINFNRRCHFFDLCQRHGERLDGEFLTKPNDYVDEEYYRLAGLEVPVQPKMPALYEEANEQ
jgi:hypothetical protein